MRSWITKQNATVARKTRTIILPHFSPNSVFQFLTQMFKKFNQFHTSINQSEPRKILWNIFIWLPSTHRSLPFHVREERNKTEKKTLKLFSFIIWNWVFSCSREAFYWCWSRKKTFYMLWLVMLINNVYAWLNLKPLQYKNISAVWFLAKFYFILDAINLNLFAMNFTF